MRELIPRQYPLKVLKAFNDPPLPIQEKRKRAEKIDVLFADIPFL
jgi:hypothetical protein